MPRARRTRKRRTRKSGSSSTGDKKPQWVSGTVANGTTTTSWVSSIVEIPLINILTGGTKVLEILKIQINRVTGNNTKILGLGSRNLSGVTTDSYPALNAARDKSFFQYGVITAENNWEWDLTDENGNGMLYPAQQIYLNMSCDTAANAIKVSFLYRIKNATMPEYVGIINQFIVTQA